jgi:deoxyribose-phosphate aldolase
MNDPLNNIDTLKNFQGYGDTNMNKKQLAGYIDHTLLKAVATEDAIKKLCLEAQTYRFAAVCVNPTHVELASNELSGSSVKVCTVIGFPLGANSSQVKGFEAAQAVKSGAEEVDMVINIGALKSGKLEVLERDITEVVSQATGNNLAALVKVIIETYYLTDLEKVTACQIAVKAGAQFVKTSTGFGPGGADVHDIKIMLESVGPEFGIKASGGISTYSQAAAMIEAGATRIGTSAGVQILSGAKG